jgi:hypothetical protein
MVLHHPRETSHPTWHLISKSKEDSVHSSESLFLIMSQLTSQICNFGRCMPDNALDQLNMVDVTDMYLMVAVHVFVFARDSFFEVVDCCFSLSVSALTFAACSYKSLRD